MKNNAVLLRKKTGTSLPLDFESCSEKIARRLTEELDHLSSFKKGKSGNLSEIESKEIKICFSERIAGLIYTHLSQSKYVKQTYLPNRD